MFIVCPSCSGPYRIPADQIAPLVQTACPHCEYRIILDFEAANDPSLRDAGQQFAQGFESAEAYASVYDHVTSKPDAQPRLGVTSVSDFGSAQSQAAQSGSRQVASASQSGSAHSASASQSGSQSARPLQRTAEPAEAATTATPPAAAASSGNRHKTVLQAPKKPVSMDPRGESPSLSGATNQVAGTSMRAGKGVDVVEPKVDEPKVEARTQPASEPSDRKPPHTPPTTGVVSSGPPASETPTPVPEDITAQSGKHPVTAQPTEPKPTEPAKPAFKPTESEGPNYVIYLIILGIVGAIITMVLLNR